MKTILLTLAALVFIRCGDSDTDTNTTTLGNQSYHEVLLSLPSSFIEGMVERPTNEGALGRNMSGYFHVRFQLGVATLGAYATYFKGEQALNYLASSIAYSFRYQQSEGDFSVAVPASLQYLGTPEPSDLASGVAFFGAALGQSLVMLKASNWYGTLPATHPAKKTIEEHRNNFQSMLNFLKRQKDVLMAIDVRASNRLFWDAVCFYTLGDYLNDEQ